MIAEETLPEIRVIVVCVSLVLVLNSWLKRTNTPSVQSVALHEERIWLVCRVWSVVCVVFSLLTLLFG